MTGFGSLIPCTANKIGFDPCYFCRPVSNFIPNSRLPWKSLSMETNDKNSETIKIAALFFIQFRFNLHFGDCSKSLSNIYHDINKLAFLATLHSWIAKSTY